ncbi:phosphatidylinositol transfer protein PDR17 [Oryza brachyantha]|uniref:CRAL-TRIO domain-containing protein n=1 Tax=Oryza brachyantha TaxID=4533 RepID=J3LSC0_ORYBR|nr:phosphatidylinositol transfer protein PDR17 [Oryza brachyantha]
MFSFRKKHASRFNSDDTEQQEEKIQELRDAIGPLSSSSEKYCTEACLRRYLEARNWNVDKSRKMLEESLKWRTAYRPEAIRWLEISLESETGKMYRASFVDREGRTVVIMRPAKQNTTSHEGQVRFLVYTLENAILSLPEDQDKMVWLIDFTGWTLANAVPIKTARECASVLQNHYPERLAVAILFNPPKVFEAFWKVTKHFLDPKSIQKVNFVYLKNDESMKIMHKYIDPEVLPVEFGGKSNVVYNHEEYSKLMVQDDIKMASFWASDTKTDHVNKVINEHSVPEVTPQSSLVAAKAS